MPVKLPTLAALMLVLILVAGCAGVQQPAPRVIVQDTHTIVRLDTDTGIKGPDDPERYAHPAEIGVAQLQTIFGAIRIQAKRPGLQRKLSKATAQHHVFKTDETAKLAPIVKDAFAQASPHERILFALTQSTGTGVEATVGEVYIKDRQLHFILDCYRRPSDSDRFISQCQGSAAPQGFELSFTQQEFLVGHGKASFFLGNGTKELVIDFGKIPASATSGS